MSAWVPNEDDLVRIRMIEREVEETEQREIGRVDLAEIFRYAPEWCEVRLREERGRPLAFRGSFLPMAQILRDPSPYIVLSAGSQVGKTTGLDGKCLCLADALPINVMHAMPTEDDRNDFYQARWQPMVRNSPWLRKCLQSEEGKSTDRVGLQQLHGRHGGVSTIFFVGMGSKRATVSRPADLVIIDELDLCPGDTLGTIQGRTGASDLNLWWLCSNPSFTGHGVGAILELSDYKRWMVPCDCGRLVDLLDDWPKCVAGEPPDARYICVKCGREIEDRHRLAGRWRRTKSSRTAQYSGYLISRLDVVRHSANRLMGDIIRIRNDPKILNAEAQIENYFLGRPYDYQGQKLSPSVLYQAVARGGHRMLRVVPPDGGGHLRAGIDVQDRYFVVVVLDGKRVVYLGTIEKDGGEWGPLWDTFLAKYEIGFAMVDPQPDTHLSETFCKAHMGRIGRLGYQTNDIGRTDSEIKERTNIDFEVNRTSMLDAAVAFVRDKEFALPSRSPEVEQFITQMTDSMIRVLDPGRLKKVALDGEGGSGKGGVLDFATANERYRYINPKKRPDHFWHALAYAVAARALRPPGLASHTPVQLGPVRQRARDWYR